MRLYFGTNTNVIPTNIVQYKPKIYKPQTVQMSYQYKPKTGTNIEPVQT